MGCQDGTALELWKYSVSLTNPEADSLVKSRITEGSVQK